MRPLTRVLTVAVLALLVSVPAASARAPIGMPPAGKLLLGMGGHAIEPQQFDALTGGSHKLHLITIPWNETRTWNEALDQRLELADTYGYRLMVHIGSQRVDDGREGRSPGAVASGVVDRYLIDMAQVLNESGQFIYLRPPAEMNGHWSQWSAFDASGARRDANHSTRAYRRAFIRITLIARGGSVAMINASLTRNGMPALRTSLDTLPASGRIAMVFNPQARGKPDIRGNQAWDYYPGANWVDYVANDLYAQSGRAAWDANEALYRRYAPTHPFMMAEYAPWGYDDPAFVKRMFAWADTHRRTVALVYFNGTGATTFRLASKPRTLTAYRQLSRRTRSQCPGFTATSAVC